MSQFVEVEEKKKKTEQPIRPAPAEPVAQRELEDVNGPEGGMLPGSVSAKIQSKRGSGRTLSGKQLEYYSEKFGRDMSDVHIHTDAESDTISRSLNARAFTIGSDVFLTKGINPDGVGRDAETMTHELTHVVQQGGHAGFGSLRLGAADTAQEHEAEATAQREFEAPKQETEDTVQRGFWGDIASSIGQGLMEGIGLGDAFSDFMSGDGKVKEAISKLSDDDRAKFKEAEENAAELEPQIKEAEATEDETYEELYDEYEDSMVIMLDMLKKADPSISEDDLSRYRSGKTRTFVSSILSTIGGSFRAGFVSGDKKEAVRQQTISSLNSSFAGRSMRADKREEEHKGLRNVIKAVWSEVQTKDDLKDKFDGWVNFKSEISGKYTKVISAALKSGKSVEDVKKAILAMMEVKKENKQEEKNEEAKEEKKSE